MASDKIIEEGNEFQPQFDSDGLIPVIAQDCQTGEVLMFARMNRESLEEIRPWKLLELQRLRKPR